MSTGTKRKRGHVVRRQKAMEPQLHEANKPLLLFRGARPGKYGVSLLQDLKKLKPLNSVMLSRKNEIFPFDDSSMIEKLCTSKDCGLFCMVSSSKKRPNNLTFGRLFNGQILDMIEFEISRYISLTQMLKMNKMAKGLDTPSVVLFEGEGWVQNESMKSFFLDAFRSSQVKEADLTTMDHVLVLTLLQDVDGKTTVRVRSYYVALKKSTKTNEGNMMTAKCPETSLIEMGPRLDLKLRREEKGNAQLMNMALKTAKVAQKRVKNVEKDAMDNKMGRVHMNTVANNEERFYHKKKDKKRLDIE